MPEDGQNPESYNYVNKPGKKKQNATRKHRQKHADLNVFISKVIGRT